MKKLVYPAIFHKADGQRYWVEFPDLPGCLTEGDNLQEAFLMAGDALDCWFDDGNQQHPTPTPLDEIHVEQGDIVQLIQPAPYLSDNAKRYAIEQAIENGLEERKLSKNQAATILSVDRSYITHIVNGKKTPSPEMAKRIALLLDFDWRIFYGNNTDTL